MRRVRWIAVFVLAALLALPAAAQATLTFARNPLNPVVYVADDDGSGVRKVARGMVPRVSPDGETLLYLASNRQQQLKIAATGGGPSRTLLSGWQEPDSLAFSPDSKTVAVLRGPELGKRTLVTVDLASGAQQKIASGYFSGFSFDPAGSGELVYARSNSERFPPRSDVFRVAPGGKPVRLTNDHRSQDPLWGPDGRIVFVKLLGFDRKYGPKNELYLMNPQGRAVKRLTHTKVDLLLVGLTPTDWSEDGSRLLAEFVGQDTSYAVAVNPGTGAQRPVQKAGEAGFVGAALSADGSLVLGSTGGFEPGPGHDVATVPYSGGRAKVLAKNGFTPAWSR
jgi:Tol biopolymer transport system component